MIQERLRTTSSKNIGLVCLGMLLISGCEAVNSIDNTFSGAGTHFVTAPSYNINSKMAAAKRPRAKVSTIKIISPRDGDTIWSLAATRSAYSGRHVINSKGYGAKYTLEGDLKTVLRQAFSNNFEVDSNSQKEIKAELTIKFSQSMQSNFWCRYWDYDTTVSMKVIVSENSKTIDRKDFVSTINDTSCTTSFIFPFAGSVSGNVQKAFQQVMEDATKEFLIVGAKKSQS